jgi:tetratricopeptide (TPR) repeat protein
MRSSGARVTADALRLGRNDPCPCGSGKKFKQCCGAAASRTAKAVPIGRPSDGAVQAAKASSRLDVGPVTEAAQVSEAAERFRQARSGLPAALLTETDAGGAARGSSLARRRMIDAERHRQLGMRLFETGKFAAAIAALRRATDLNPGDAGSHHMLGRALLRGGHLTEAVGSLRLAVTLKDDAAPVHRDLAVVLAAAGQNREAVAACRRAVALAPESAEGHRLLGELLETAGELNEAAQCSRRAAASTRDAAAGRLDLARAAVLEGDLSVAETCLRQAIAHDKNSDQLHKALGDVLAKRGRFDEAIEACDRALDANPLYAPAHLTAVRVRKCTEADRPRLQRMLAALRDASIDDATRLFLHFAIGKLLDDLGEHREAIKHFDTANSIRRRNLRFDRVGLNEVIDRLIGRFTSAFFAANRSFGLVDETPLLIVGMPRSGTTLVEQIVSAHPAVAAGEELFFWSNRASSRGVAEATALTAEAARDLAAEYISLLRRIGPSALRVTDKQPFNFQQLGLIHSLLPGARIIHCRRHPIDTCLSMYFTYFKGRVPFVSDRADLAFAYQQYARIMQHWRSVLPPDRFLEVDYEKLVADREAVTRRLIGFCGLDWHDACLQPESNERTVTTASLWQARQPVFASSVERWRRYEPWLGELRQLLPPADAVGPSS